MCFWFAHQFNLENPFFRNKIKKLHKAVVYIFFYCFHCSLKNAFTSGMSKATPLIYLKMCSSSSYGNCNCFAEFQAFYEMIFESSLSSEVGENESSIFVNVADRIWYATKFQQSKTKSIFSSFKQQRSQYALVKCKIPKFYKEASLNLNKRLMSSRDEQNLWNTLHDNLGQDFSPPKLLLPTPPPSWPSLIRLGLSFHNPSSYMNHFQHWVLIIIYKVTF